MSAALTRKLGEAHERMARGDVAGAQSLCRELLQRAPRNPDVLHLLAVTELASGHPREAKTALEQALAAAPQHGSALEYLGLAHLMLGEFDAAERALRAATLLPGAPASVWMRLGVALLEQGKAAESIRELEHALRLDAGNADVYLNLGHAAARLGDVEAARQHFESALRLAPAHADAMFNLGVLALEAMQLDAARLWFERAIAAETGNVDALINLGIVHERAHRLDDALACYQRALQIAPSNARAHSNLAHALAQLSRLEAAREHYLKAIGLAPDLSEAHEGLAATGVALAIVTGQVSHLPEAEASARRALALDPDAAESYRVLSGVYILARELERAVEILETGYRRTGDSQLLGSLTLQLRHLCDWDRWQVNWPQVSALIEQGADVGDPLTLFCEPTTAGQQLSYARIWSGKHFGHVVPDHTPRRASAGESSRLRVGYLSSDFREHAVAYLLASVLESHDRARYEIFAYSYADDSSPMRARIGRACEHFVDIAHESDDAAFRRIRDDHLDILVDLNGHTQGARTAILARRPCAALASWLGYAGTMGADFIDYLIADPFTIPAGDELKYAERVLRLPHCLQPRDRERRAAAPLSRSAYALPEDAVVFCCFNQAFKITPELFACWMRVLHRAPASILWLREDNRWAVENLKRAANALGIAADRLIFAPKLASHAEHLARYAVANAALDTFPYGSHTTAGDALSEGCPLIALCGETFASRVSGSILTACNMPDLVCHTIEDFENLAYRIVTDEPFRKDLRARLAKARSEASYFDTARFTKDLEQLYERVVRGELASNAS